MGILLFINSSLQLWQSSLKIFYFSEISVAWKTRIEVYLIFFIIIFLIIRIVNSEQMFSPFRVLVLQFQYRLNQDVQGTLC